MSTPDIVNCQLTKLPSGVYELEWFIARPGDVDLEPDRKSGFYTKAQLMKLANSNKTYEGIRDFLQEQFRAGTTIR